MERFECAPPVSCLMCEQFDDLFQNDMLILLIHIQSIIN